MKPKHLLFPLVCLLLLSLLLPLTLQAEAALDGSSYLFFDFSAIDDHSGSQYGGLDFGSSKRWGTTGGTTDTLAVDTASGTLSITRTDPNAYTYFYAQTWNADSSTRYPLSFVPNNAEYLQVRMKLSGFDPAVKTTRFCLNYYMNGSTTQQMDGASHSFGTGYTFDGTYITLSLKLNDAFRSAAAINGIKLNFWDLKGTGTVVFDYVYIGPKAGLPGQAPLYFDFKNSSEDQSRYSTDTYNHQNYDTASAWNGTYLSSTTKDGISVNNSQGTLTLTKTAANSYSYFYAMNSKQLHYRPEKAEYLQMRLKLSGFQTAGSNSSFSLNYYTDGASTQYTNAATYKFEKGFVFEGEYLTLTLPLSDAFIGSNLISQIKLNFWNLGGTGTVVFDYVYIGSKAELPSKDYLRFGFVTSEGQAIVAQQNCLITDGVTESTLKFNTAAKDNQAVGFLTTIEPNAQVSFKASYSGYYTKGSTPASRAQAAPNLPWKLETSTSQAAAYEAATGGKVLLATNADFYNVTTYQPKGYLIMEGNVLQTYDSRQQPFFAVLKDGSLAIRDFGSPIADVAEAVSGVWLVMDGKNVTDTYYHSTGYKENQPMNAIGLTADGTMHMFVVDGRQSPYSMGMDVNDLSNLFVSLGCVNAICLDGGGSATHASVHQGTTTLRLRNSPSDGKERAISNALLMISTAGQCDHSYTKNYVINSDGTHTVSCSKCTSKITSAHLYTNSRCACGATEASPDYLYFTFSNTAEDRARYQNAAYGYWNFDNPTGNPWTNSNWSTANNGDKRNHYRIDNAQGVLIADVTDSGNGPLIAPTNSYGVFPWLLENFYKYFPLNYSPKNGEYFQIRFKTEGCSPVVGATPRVDLHYYYKKDGAYAGKTDVARDFTIKNGSYQTFTIPLTDTFRNADTLANFAIRFRNFTATGGSLSIDYIYMGPKDHLPTPLHTVTFVDGNGKTLQTQLVQNGSNASYTGSTPTKAYDTTYHYSFKAWDKALTNITANTTITATFTATPHGYSYTKVDAATHRAACSCGYSRLEAHSYKEGFCLCGEPEIKEPVEDVSLKLNHSLNLASDISVNLLVSKTLLEGFDLSTVYVESTLSLYDGNGQTGTATLRMEPVENGNYYYFTLKGLTAVQMNDSISSVLYGTKNGQPYFSPVDEYSIAAYAYSQLNNPDRPEKLKILCADLLRYGSYAQRFKAYRTDALADAPMTDTHKAYLSNMESVPFGNTNRILSDLPDPTITWVGKSLDLQSKVTLKFIFSTANYTGSLSDLRLHVTYTDLSGEAVTAIVTDLEAYAPELNRYAFSFSGLLAAELRSAVSVQIYEANTPISPSLQYSADTYGANKEGILLTLCKALFAYSDSAKAYFQT